MKFKFILLLAFVFHSGFSQDLKEKDFLRIRSAVFEVVRPFKIEYDNVKFSEAINYDTLPLSIKNKKYESFGTAFAISPKKIVSAAHVFNIHYKGFYKKDVMLRDKNGKLHEIDKIIQYDQRKDYVVFTLKTYPKNLEFLKTSGQSKIGQTVFSIGNALGEGVVERKGRITSFTDEQYKQDFKYIRFTAPASPGNSGGPLVDSNGEVIGVVIAKSANENLNYSTPVNLVVQDKLPYASFYDRGVVEVDDGEELFSVWEHKIKLPVSYVGLYEKATLAFKSSILERRKNFEEKYKDKIFPSDKGIEVALRSQSSGPLFYELIKDTKSERWLSASYKKIQTVEYEKDTNLYFQVEGDRIATLKGEFYIEKPNRVSLKSFIDQPKEYFDSFLKVMKVYLNVVEQKLFIHSFGKPVKIEKWTDAYSRKWISSSYEAQLFGAVITTHCLPEPYGVACILRSNPIALADTEMFYFKLKASRMVLGLSGGLNQWQEFIDLPQSYKSQSNNAIKIIANKNKVKIEDAASGLKISYTGKYSRNAEIELHYEHGLDLKNETVSKISMVPSDKNDKAIHLVHAHKVHKDESKEYKKLSKNIFSRKGIYDGRVHAGKSVKTQMHVADDKRYPKNEAALIYICQMENKYSKKDMKKFCAQFFKNNGLAK